MEKFVLSNGLRVIHKKKSGNSVVVQVMVNIGSNNEMESELGISHFLEHILFEGTKKRTTNREIANEIEKIGGEFNAYTTNERTCFYVRVLKKHFLKAVDILADIIQNSQFTEEAIAKEKNIILKEIDMINDEPRFYQWLLLQNTLFVKHPCRYPTYGDREVIKSLTRKKILDYFEKFYIPNNITLSIVGDVNNWKKSIEKAFKMEKKVMEKRPLVKEPASTKITIKKEKRKIANTYTVLGFKTVSRDHKDAFALEVISGVLGRGQSGKMFTEIRSNRGLAYDVGTQNICEITFGFFAVYASVDRKNVKLVQKLILQEIEKLNEISEQDLKEAKDFVEGSYLLELEDSQKIADQLLFWEQVKDAKLMDSFVNGIRKVSVADVKRVVEKYFKNYALVVLEGK